ncbi:hypothetical protein HBB16_20380 [Pseudonocardia sp. MCCB 268]|nr:hypothetical protein [Pseudonocardia cytotoxica]
MGDLTTSWKDAPMPLRVVQSRRPARVLGRAPSPSPIWSARARRPAVGGRTARPRARCRRAAVPGNDVVVTPTCSTSVGPAAGYVLLYNRRLQTESIQYLWISPAASERGITVTHTPGRTCSRPRPTLPSGLILSARRRLPPPSPPARRPVANLRDGRSLGLDVHGATLGLVGFGQIGRLPGARPIRACACCSTTRMLPPAGDASPVGMDELLRDADIVSPHVPLTPGDPAPDRRRRAGGDEADGDVDHALARRSVVGRGGVARGARHGPPALGRVDVFETEPLPAERIAVRRRALVGDAAAHRLGHRGDPCGDGRPSRPTTSAALTGELARTPVPGSLPNRRKRDPVSTDRPERAHLALITGSS